MASSCGFKVAFLCKTTTLSVVCVNNFFTRCSAVYKILSFPVKSTRFSCVDFSVKPPYASCFLPTFHITNNINHVTEGKII